MSRTKKAPQYFLDIQKEMDKAEEIIAEMLGVKAWWIKEQRRKKHYPKDFMDKVIKDWTKDKNKKFNVLLVHRGACVEYRWLRFRLDNLDNDYGKAERLEYDEEKNLIVMKKGIREVLNKFMTKIKKELPEIESFKIEHQ